MDKFSIEQARKLKGLSQAKMASLLDLSETAYVNKEKGMARFYLDEALKFSDIVGLPLEKIIFFD